MIRKVILAAALCLVATPAFAQVDLSGMWASRLHEDWMERNPGPDVLDLTGLPINDDARARAAAYSPSLLATPERQCLFYNSTYFSIGPFGFMFWSEAEPVGGRVIAWNIGGNIDITPRKIWMDGRPHPSEDAPHTTAGFSTGEWQGRTLVVKTTHMKASPLRRNGTPLSDQTTMTEYIVRHGTFLAITAIIEDPVYMTEPVILSRNYEYNPNMQMTVYPRPCTPAIEAPGLEAGEVPHYLNAEENPFANQMASRYGLPLAVTLGGAETLYPEFRKQLQGSYKPPESCGRYCCGWTGINFGETLATTPLASCIAREEVRIRR